MSQHSVHGGNIEVMGMLLGAAQEPVFDIVDSFALPVEATETRVNAMGESYEYISQYLQVYRDTGHFNDDIKVVGWYHSHPGYGCFLSRIDIETQSQNQQFQDPFVAIVVDPIKTIEQAQVEIGAFRTKGNPKTFYNLAVEYYGRQHDMTSSTSLDNTTWAQTLSR